MCGQFRCQLVQKNIIEEAIFIDGTKIEANAIREEATTKPIRRRGNASNVLAFKLSIKQQQEKYIALDYHV